MTPREVLKNTFGYDSFRPGQETLVKALAGGRDVLGIMPTGAGKSLCYQVPALVRGGTALVISPLISLMKDQVAALKAAGVPGAYLNTSLTPAQMDLAMERAREGWYRIIYVAPERLGTPSFRRLCGALPISLVAVDEAHCVSQWGQDFRPEYLRIADFLRTLPARPPLGAFTATATSRVSEDIRRLLELRDPVCVTTGFDRPNLYFEVLRPKHRKEALLRVMEERRGSCGIVYCATRKATEEVCDLLIAHGFRAGRYHAGLPDEERRQTQEDFQYDRLQVICATNAFGMGIDKSNVRYVIHYNMPKSMEAYYQEAGRAGRDGEPADCILLYQGSDIYTARSLILHGEPNPNLTPGEAEQVRRQEMRRLQDMIHYCTSDGCLRCAILRYFGERGPERCGSCGNCAGRKDAGAEAAAPASRKKAEKVPKLPGKMPVNRAAPPADTDPLYERLRACRLAQANEHKLPPYVVATDKTLADLVRKKPTTREALLEVTGFGEMKAERFGEPFLRIIRESLGMAVPASPDAPWTADELEKLRSLLKEERTVREIARVLGREEREVLGRAIELRQGNQNA